MGHTKHMEQQLTVEALRKMRETAMAMGTQDSERIRKELSPRMSRQCWERLLMASGNLP